jgi:hypothetical protein
LDNFGVQIPKKFQALILVAVALLEILLQVAKKMKHLVN